MIFQTKHRKQQRNAHDFNDNGSPKLVYVLIKVVFIYINNLLFVEFPYKFHHIITISFLKGFVLNNLSFKQQSINTHSTIQFVVDTDPDLNNDVFQNHYNFT